MQKVDPRNQDSQVELARSHGIPDLTLLLEVEPSEFFNFVTLTIKTGIYPRPNYDG